MKECNTIEIGIGNILAEIENSFNVIVKQRLQQYNECNANSKCENTATVYGNIENSNNIELNENLIQNNFCKFGSNCMNIGTISSETLMEEAKTILLELTQENKCKNQATCINEFNMNDLDTTSNYQENICIGGTCINTGINSKIISNHADCLNSGIDTTMICNKKVQITKSPEKISVSKTVLASKD
jgi:pyruvate/2-oxoglutarate dehydrogenase complex dihydrolipoamide dehydrogenase (E3) component